MKQNSLIHSIREQVSWLRSQMGPKNADRINDALCQLQTEMNEKDALISQYRAVKKSYPQWEQVKSTTPLALPENSLEN